jgi:hypothetical protein
MTRISAAALYLMLWEAIELAKKIWPVTFGDSYRSIQFETEPAAISGSRACSQHGLEGHLKRNPWSLSSDLLAFYAQPQAIRRTGFLRPWRSTRSMERDSSQNR